jgi:mono/diheme cytochrome c family protein
MPKHNFLKDEEMAQVLTFIRQNFGNDEDAVTVSDVRRVLKK